ncbi:Sua5/YciO/YrdC/YwlC family protein [Candidatus Woesearchaeota archaeon]|nr:Sua5/YciO/YrdC/YwlC family protein [Candidatus Woesearchaeota archaeon]
MVRIITKEEISLDPRLVEQLKNSVFIYPTDTIYGIGCDATREDLVQRVRDIKERQEQPFSIIIPNKALVYQHCEVDKMTDKVKPWMDKMPGPFTFIFRVKSRFFADNVIPGIDSIGIRIPNHWFFDVVKRMKVPIVTTSVNKSGEDFMTSLEDLNPDIRRQVDFIVEDGTLKGKPSTLVHFEKDGVETQER